MTEIDGHYNMPDKTGYVCRLLRKAVSAHGARLVVVADAAALEALDLALWKLAPSEFIAHCRSDDAPFIVERSPVVLADSAADALPDRPILVNLGAGLPARFERFERLIDIVGSDDADRQAGRARWRHYKDRGYAIRTHAYGGSAGA
ncbi:DNA polymerase III subunit chi [Variovorax saccharolyticus]|uniref:DNA polymerase III subunit chi n=1 Tax=Variovorax saccharolyticus TaxID=3053516 RepID=UPI002578C07F|nr:DNA polymerase III subunit chi [Variovorax sp. J22R187]MDM0017028.1 DNA polymerase III subunit chi [Variovorax sp. J22R187]